MKICRIFLSATISLVYPGNLLCGVANRSASLIQCTLIQTGKIGHPQSKDASRSGKIVQQQRIIFELVKQFKNLQRCQKMFVHQAMRSIDTEDKTIGSLVPVCKGYDHFLDQTSSQKQRISALTSTGDDQKYELKTWTFHIVWLSRDR